MSSHFLDPENRFRVKVRIRHRIRVGVQGNTSITRCDRASMCIPEGLHRVRVRLIIRVRARVYTGLGLGS